MRSVFSEVIMQIHTETGSVYQIDSEKKQIRKIGGTPTQRQGALGTWKAYEELSNIKIGAPVFIFWTDQENLLSGAVAGTDGVYPATVTSRVTAIVQ